MSPEISESFVVKLSSARPIRHRKMFGGLGFYFEEIFFAIADDDKLFFKVDDGNRQPYLDAGMDVWYCGGVATPAYRELPEHIVNNPELLGLWIEESAAAAVRLKKAKK